LKNLSGFVLNSSYYQKSVDAEVFVASLTTRENNVFLYRKLTDIVPAFSFLVLPMANKTTSESYDNEQKRTIGAIS